MKAVTRVSEFQKAGNNLSNFNKERIDFKILLLRFEEK